MTDALREMLSSKKFLAAIAAIILQIAARYGLQLDQEQVTLLITPILAYILGQGIADSKKPSVVNAAAVVERQPPPLPAPPPGVQP